MPQNKLSTGYLLDFKGIFFWLDKDGYRLAIPALIEKGKQFRDIPIEAQEITAIYLGCNMKETAKSKLIKNVKQLNPLIKVFLGRRHDNTYGLIFDQVT